MSPENPSQQLNLVTFNHTELDCPVYQTTPDAARTLSGSLADARKAVGKIPGAFLPADHRGAAIVPGNIAEVLAMFRNVLSIPAHDVVVNPLVDADPRLQDIAASPTLLEGDSEAAVVNRTLLFQTAHAYMPKLGYDESIANATPSLSLVELEGFLDGKADEIAARAAA